jgi:hypothetical protein
MRVHFCRSTIALLPILADEVKRVLAVVGADYGDFDGDENDLPAAISESLAHRTKELAPNHKTAFQVPGGSLG